MFKRCEDWQVRIAPR